MNKIVFSILDNLYLRQKVVCSAGQKIFFLSYLLSSRSDPKTVLQSNTNKIVLFYPYFLADQMHS
jgi:hypothetical protein